LRAVPGGMVSGTKWVCTSIARATPRSPLVMQCDSRVDRDYYFTSRLDCF
jgi:hypothetical protein